MNKKKFVFAQTEVEYCGFTVSEHGYTVSGQLVEALRDFPIPVSKQDVRSFCGLLQQFEAFSLGLTDWLVPLRWLLSNKTTFVREEPQQNAFETVLRELTKPRILANFDHKSPLRLETDAAQSNGLAMALWQQQEDDQWRLLQCSSRHVMRTESRYSATEIELLAVVWAARRECVTKPRLPTSKGK